MSCSSKIPLWLGLDANFVGAPDLNILRGEVMLDALDAQEAGSAEERRRPGAVAESGRYQRNTLVYLKFRLIQRHPPKGERMAVAVSPNGVARIADAPHVFGEGVGHLANQEKGKRLLSRIRDRVFPAPGSIEVAKDRRRK
jgi:hypothetical protein